MKIGIVGMGYVGHAAYEVFKRYYDVVWSDTAEVPFAMQRVKENGTEKDLRDMEKCRIHTLQMARCDVVFVCVPTPMNKDGKCNTSIVESVVMDIGKTAREDLIECPIIVVKSTVTPYTCLSLNEKLMTDHIQFFPVVFNPEFLTERNYLKDFENQEYIIIGGYPAQRKVVRSLYTKIFPNTPIIEMTSVAAEMVKYALNCYFATKVSFLNDISDMCQALDIDYDVLVEVFRLDSRMGKTHLNVPGPDGKAGFGGSCFPKDMNSIMALARVLNIDLPTIEGAWKTNLKVRPEKDWELLKGRAVSEN